MNKKIRFNINTLLSIRARIVAMAVGGILIALIVAFISIVPGASNSLTDSVENNMLDLAKTHIKILNNNINAINETVSSMNSSADIYNCLLSEGETYLVETALKQYIRNNSTYSEAAIYNKEGKFIATSGDSSNKEDAPYYVNAVLSTGLPAQSDIIVDGVDTPSIVCAIPLTNSGDMYGVVCVTVPASIITADLAEASLKNIESSFPYLISPQGYIIYHPEEKYIGKIIGNETIRDFLSKGNVASAIVQFNYDHSNKLVGLATSETNNWMLVIQANKSELLSSINRLISMAIVILLVILIILVTLVYFIASSVTNPIKKVTTCINNFANLDLRDDANLQKVSRRRDETGEMGRALDIMQQNIKEIIGTINDASSKLIGSNDKLNSIASSLSDCANDNSNISTELADSMEHTSTLASSINSDVDNIKSQTASINIKSQDTISLSNNIMNRANEARETTVKASNSTKELYQEVSKEAQLALEQSKSVNKINDLTANIMNIADQTSLLAINASIEAARSGEYGKGFAVVANEISTLAAQSSNTVNDIMNIVTEVTQAVDNIDKCLSKTLSFMESSVMKDYDNFIKVSGEYNNDANYFANTIKDICNNIQELEHSTNQIAAEISNINDNIIESSDDVTNIAKRASDVVTLSSDTYEKVQDNVSMATTLNNIVDRFTLE